MCLVYHTVLDVDVRTGLDAQAEAVLLLLGLLSMLMLLDWLAIHGVFNDFAVDHSFRARGLAGGKAEEATPAAPVGCGG